MENRFSILIAEDDPVSRLLLERTLIKAGHEVVSCSDGREAMELFAKRFFPIVITDWMMPEMDGLELCRAIRNTVSKGYVFVFVLTARDSREDMIAGLEAGADDYLTKPFDRSELFARLKTAIRLLKLEKSLKEANEAIRVLSITDALTGCFNRTYMDEQLPKEVIRAVRYGHPLSVAMVDIDHFKKVNDMYGHQGGDQTLKSLVQIINGSIRSGVDWIARYGGEEFIIVFPETDFKTAGLLAERLREKVSGLVIPFETDEIRITASFGVTGVRADQSSADVSFLAMINRADKALYQAKAEGRNRVNTMEMPGDG